MRQFTSVALAATYLCLALIVALLLWRNGGGWAAGVAALVGGLALCASVHAMVSASLKMRTLQRGLDMVRGANTIPLLQMEKIDPRLSEVVETMTDEAVRRSEELHDEVHILEDLVQRMGQDRKSV